MGNYSPRTKYCHLVINNDYRGIYVLTERIKRGKSRVDIAKLNKQTTNKDSITGGYIVKLDKGKGEAWRSPYSSKIDSGYGKWFLYVYPKPNNLNKVQKAYITNYISDFETALLNHQNWEDYIDVESFIDHMLITEMMKNVDGYRLSTFYSKDRGAKLKAEPLWDLNLTFGLTSYYDGYKETGFMYSDEASPFWWQYFMKNQNFRKMLKARWIALRETTFSETAIDSYVDEEFAILKADVHYNTEKWLSYKESSNWRKEDHKSFEESVTYLKQWIKKRTNYLDQFYTAL
jgi:hypothetical protein